MKNTELVKKFIWVFPYHIILWKFPDKLSGQLNISGDTDFLLTINYCMNMCGRQGLKKKQTGILGFEPANVTWL